MCHDHPWERFYRGYVAEPRAEEVADSVFAYVQPDGSWGLNNTGFVVGGDECLVVDTCLTEGRTRSFRQVIEDRGAKPTVLVNTHHHSDHTFGNFVFKDVPIVAQERCRTEVIAEGLAPLEKDPAVPWGDVEVWPPGLLFQDRLDVHVDDRKVELRYVGPAHTNNDVIAWLPAERVLFAGDVLFNDATPIIWQGSLTGSIRALDRMAELGPTTIVPGHGAVCGPDVLDDWRRYFAFLADTAQHGHDEGLTPLETAREASLGEFADWQHPERLVINLHRAFAELEGAEGGIHLDYGVIFEEMLSMGSQAYGHRLIEGREEYVR